MDDIDRQILGILATDGRASFSHIGRVVGLSTNAAASRVRRLESDGVILGYRAVLADAAEVDVPVTSIEAFVDIRLREGVDSERFLDWAGGDPAVLDAFT